MESLSPTIDIEIESQALEDMLNLSHTHLCQTYLNKEKATQLQPKQAISFSLFLINLHL